MFHLDKKSITLQVTLKIYSQLFVHEMRTSVVALCDIYVGLSQSLHCRNRDSKRLGMHYQLRM